MPRPLCKSWVCSAWLEIHTTCNPIPPRDLSCSIPQYPQELVQDVVQALQGQACLLLKPVLHQSLQPLLLRHALLLHPGQDLDVQAQAVALVQQSMQLLYQLAGQLGDLHAAWLPTKGLPHPEEEEVVDVGTTEQDVEVRKLALQVW